MPIYVYRCMDCNQEHEALQKLSDTLLIDCPNCGAPKLQKQVTAAGFQLKGTGWYVTDFKGNGKAKKDSDPSTKPESKQTSDKASDHSPQATDNTKASTTEKTSKDSQTSNKNKTPTNTTTSRTSNTNGTTH